MGPNNYESVDLTYIPEYRRKYLNKSDDETESEVSEYYSGLKHLPQKLIIKKILTNISKRRKIS